MSALSVPKTVIKKIDSRMRAFLWTGDDKCHGSKCLVAWEFVQAPKDRGGLGVKNLELQNRCLLMKFIDKMLSRADMCWKDWIDSTTATFDTPVAGETGFLWRIIYENLDTFRSITYVRLNNGASTSFWLDHWLPAGPLASTHSALFSHTLRPNTSVQCVFNNGFDLRLRPRLTTAASQQLGSLLEIL
jgi:hypothetical protein